MKNRFFAVCVMLMTGVMAITGCGQSSSARGAIYANYIEKIMRCSYYGELDGYTEVVAATKEEAQKLYDTTVEYYANELMSYNEVMTDYISDDLYNRYVDAARKIMAKVKFEIKGSTKVDNDYQVRIEISPVDINDATTDDISKYVEEYNKMLEKIDTASLSDEEWTKYEEQYGETVLNIIESHIDTIGYKDVISKVVIIDVDSDGYFGISDDDWYDIDDYVVDMK